jgi:hypothetical protein
MILLLLLLLQLRLIVLSLPAVNDDGETQREREREKKKKKKKKKQQQLRRRRRLAFGHCRLVPPATGLWISRLWLWRMTRDGHRPTRPWPEITYSQSWSATYRRSDSLLFSMFAFLLSIDIVVVVPFELSRVLLRIFFFFFLCCLSFCCSYLHFALVWVFFPPESFLGSHQFCFCSCCSMLGRIEI